MNRIVLMSLAVLLLVAAVSVEAGPHRGRFGGRFPPRRGFRHSSSEELDGDDSNRLNIKQMLKAYCEDETKSKDEDLQKICDAVKAHEEMRQQKEEEDGGNDNPPAGPDDDEGNPPEEDGGDDPPPAGGSA